MNKIDNLFDVSGKVVVITGGGGVLCGNIAKTLAERGAKVAVLDIKKEACDLVADEINRKGDNVSPLDFLEIKAGGTSHSNRGATENGGQAHPGNGGQAIAVVADVLEKKDLEKAKDKILKKFKRIDILINGAGGNKEEATTSANLSFFDIPKDALHSVFALNFLGTFLTCQVFGNVFAKQKEGIILNISSMASLKPLTKIAVYSAAKSAVNNFTQWLAVHMAKEYSPKIRVNAIAPGFFLTDQNMFLLVDKKTGKQTLRGKQIIEHTPMARYGEAKDLVGTVIWLLSPASEFITGMVIPVDGGFSVYSGV